MSYCCRDLDWLMCRLVDVSSEGKVLGGNLRSWYLFGEGRLGDGGCLDLGELLSKVGMEVTLTRFLIGRVTSFQFFWRFSSKTFMLSCWIRIESSKVISVLELSVTS